MLVLIFPSHIERQESNVNENEDEYENGNENENECECERAKSYFLLGMVRDRKGKEKMELYENKYENEWRDCSITFSRANEGAGVLNFCVVGIEKESTSFEFPCCGWILI